MDCTRTMTQCMSPACPWHVQSLINLKWASGSHPHYNMTSVFVPMWSRVGVLHIGHVADLPVRNREKMDHYDYLSQINFYYYLASSNITNHLLWEHVKWTKLYLHLMYFHLHFNFIKINKISRIVCTTPKFLPRWGRCWRWVEPPTKFSKKRGLTATQFLERGCWKRRVWSFFSGGCSF